MSWGTHLLISCEMFAPIYADLFYALISRNASPAKIEVLLYIYTAIRYIGTLWGQRIQSRYTCSSFRTILTACSAQLCDKRGKLALERWTFVDFTKKRDRLIFYRYEKNEWHEKIENSLKMCSCFRNGQYTERYEKKTIMKLQCTNIELFEILKLF